MPRLYLVTRDLHLYVGLLISPFILLFAVSVFYLVHARPKRVAPAGIEMSRTVSSLAVPAGVAGLQGRARVDALRPVLDQLGVGGEVDFIRHVASEHRLVIPVRVPGRETTVRLDYEGGTAIVSSRNQPLAARGASSHGLRGTENLATESQRH